MQRKKAYYVSFFVDLHAVTCPGVWLCPKGKVAVRVAIFGVSELTKKLIPSFPLFFHERFHFQKKYKKVGSLHQVERILHRAPVTLELLQYPQGTNECVKLAEFKATVGDIIYPPGGDMDLLFHTTNTFPGIIGPKGEVTTRLTLTEGGIKDTYAMPTTVLSKGTKGKQIEEPVIRQKPVCHTKHYLYCGCFDKNAPPLMLAKALKKRKELLAKKRTSQEVITHTPAHIMSHKNHGDFLPGYEEQPYECEGGAVKFGKCIYCQEQAAFRETANHTPSIMSEESLVKERNMKDGFTRPMTPQPKWSPSIDYKYEKYLAEETEKNHAYPADMPSSYPQNGEGPCCLCCPRAPGYVMKRKSSTENNQSPEIQSIPMDGEKNQYYLMEKKHQNYPMVRNTRQYNAPEEKTFPSNSMVRKKDSSALCPGCDNGNKLMDFIRKKNGNKPKEENGQPLFYSNLCKAYQRLMHEYYLTPPGVSSSGYANRPGTL